MDFKKIRIFFKRNLTTTIIVAVLLFLFCASFGSSLLESWKLYSYKQELISQIAEGREKSSQLDEDIKQIGSQEYIERIARQYLELYYPNEQIVIPVENNLTKEDVEAKAKEQAGQQADGQTAATEEQPTEEIVEDTETTTEEPVEESPVEEPATETVEE